MRFLGLSREMVLRGSSEKLLSRKFLRLGGEGVGIHV